MHIYIDWSFDKEKNLSISTCLIDYRLYFFEIQNKIINIYGENIQLNAFQAEFFAFLIAFSIIKNKKFKNTIIFTDSQALYGIVNKIFIPWKSMYHNILKKLNINTAWFKLEKINREYNLADLQNVKFIDLQKIIEFKTKYFFTPIKYEENITFDDMMLAYKRAKKWKWQRFLAFEENLFENINKLYQQVEKQTYTPKPYICFIKQQRKYREIFMTEVEDLIVEHLILEKIRYRFEKNFFYDVWNHMLWKWTHKAQLRLKKIIKKCSNNYDKDLYYLKADIKWFFYNIDRNILRKLLFKKINEPKLRYLLDQFLLKEPNEYCNFKFWTTPEQCKKLKRSLFKTPKWKWIPLGNVLSQFFANVYLHQLDFFIKMKLKCKYYIRYADDFVILSENENELKELKLQIRDFLKNELDISLSTHKTYIKQVRKWVRRLGKKFYYYDKEKLLNYHYTNFNKKINQAIKRWKNIEDIANGYKGLI